MQKLAPLTKLLLTVAVSLWAIMLTTVPALIVLVGVQLAMLVISKVAGKTYKAVSSLLAFAVILAGIQYGLGSGMEVALITGLRMTAMTLIFIVMLATTRMQDITAALVRQCRVPYEYAFMLTAALRFIPDFIAESKAVQEAQACRGYRPQGNIMKRIAAYVAVVEPLVLKAVTKSETMALSLELRGFGGHRRSFAASIGFSIKDYCMFVLMTAVTVGVIIEKAG